MATGSSTELPSPRLNSWKEIAGYLGRDARTVQRWEKNEGLPVHRYWHESQASVYSTTAELDEWLARRGRVQAIPAKSSFLRRPVVSLAATLATVLIATAAFFQPWKPNKEPPAFQGDWVLLDAIENRTGESMLDGALRLALERELSGSNSLRGVERERIEESLRLMRKPSGTHLDRDVAREVCLRDGDIPFFVAGKMEKSGSGYAIRLELIEPGENQTLSEDTETATGPDEVWHAANKLSGWLINEVGHRRGALAHPSTPLPKVTTASLKALQLYAEASAAAAGRDRTKAAARARLALKEDPEFASAHLLLAVTSSDAERSQAAARALELAAHVPDRERYLIQAHVYQMTARFDEAVPAYEALLRLAPNDTEAMEGISDAYGRTGRKVQAAEWMTRVADLRPANYASNLGAARVLKDVDMGKARIYADRASMIAAKDGQSRINFALLFSFHERWLANDAAGAVRELERVVRLYPTLDKTSQRIVAGYVYRSHLALGQLEAAKAWIGRLDEPARHSAAAFISFLGGVENPCEPHLSVNGPLPRQNAFGLLLLARCRPPGAVRIFAASLRQDDAIPEPLLSYDQGEFALLDGRIDDAVAILKKSFEINRYRGQEWSHAIADALVLALERQGNLEEAVKVLEQTSADRLWTTPGNTAYAVFWMRNQARLAYHYRRLGRVAEGAKIDRGLRSLLAMADRDHPIVRQLGQ